MIDEKKLIDDINKLKDKQMDIGRNTEISLTDRVRARHKYIAYCDVIELIETTIKDNIN